MTIIEFLSQPLCQRISMTLLHFVWQGLVVMSLVLVFVKLFKAKHGNARYFVYLTGFIIMMACPLITFVIMNANSENGPVVSITDRNDEAGLTEPIYVESKTVSAPVNLPETENSISLETTNIPVTFNHKVSMVNHRASDYLHSSLPWLLATWLTGVFILSLHLIIGFIGIHRCRKNCKPLPERISSSVKRLSNKLGIRNFTNVFMSSRIINAIAIGYLRPMILLPTSMVTQLTPEMLEAVIAHELAHIRRYDLWVNLIQRIAETLLFYHPAIWWLSSRIRTEREYCCDELAVQATRHRLNYAAALESAGRISIMPKQLAFAEGMCRDKKTLLKRVQYILGLTPTHKNNSSWITSIVTISLITLIIVSSALCFTEKTSADLDEDKNVPGYVQEINVVIQKWLEACKNNNIEQVNELLKTKDSPSIQQIIQIGKMIEDAIGQEHIIPVKVSQIESDKVNGAFFIATTESGFFFNGNPSYIAVTVHKVDNEWLIESVTYSDQETADRTFDSIQKNYPDNYNIWEKESYTKPGELKNNILKENLKAFEETEWNQLENAPKEAKEIAGIVHNWISAGLRNDMEIFKGLYTANGQRYAESNFEQLQNVVFSSTNWQFSPMIIRISESVAEIVSHEFVIKPPVPGYGDATMTLNVQLMKADGKWGILTFSNQEIKDVPNSSFTRKYPDAQIWVDKSTPGWLNPLQKSEVDIDIESLKSTAQKILTEAHDNTLAQKLRAELGEQKIFESYFPDSVEGGKILDEWWSKSDSDSEADKKIFDIVRNGLRTDGKGEPRQRRNQYFINIGSKYIWRAGEQNKDAIELLYYASFDPQLAGDAVYYGLSVTREKSGKIMKRLVELCMEDVSVGRIVWGTQGKHNDLLPYLKPYLESDSTDIKERAKVLERVFKEEIDYGKWSGEQLAERLRDGLGDKLPEIKETLLNGASIQRKDILDLIRRNRLSLLFDMSFEESLRACLSDGNPTVREYAIDQYRTLFSKPGECPDEILDIMETLSKDNNDKVREAATTFIGGNWVWGANPQNPKAIDIMYRLSSDKDQGVKYNAVYYGLSVVSNKNKKIIDRLVEMAMDESNDLGRIAWGLGNGADMQIIKETLSPYLKPGSAYSQRAEQLYKEIFKVDPPGIQVNNQEQEPEALGENSTENENSFLTALINSASEGSIVMLPKGTYKVPVSINKTITLKGEDANNCIIELTKNGPAITVDTKGVGKVTLENLTIKWQLATSDQSELPFAVYIKDSETYIKNCSFIPLGNYQRCPVALRAVGFSKMIVSNCTFEGFNFTVQYAEGTEGTFNNNVVQNSGHQGVTLYAGAKAAISNNIIAGSMYHGLRSTGGEFNVTNNLIINNKNRGIYIGNKSASGTISNNLLINNTEGMSGFASSKLTINNNVFVDSSFAALDMRDSCALTIGNNVFVNNQRGLKLIKEGSKDNNKIEINTFWDNEKDLEDITVDAEQINADPQFIAPEDGDFGLNNATVKERNQGLTDPQIVKELWKKWQTIKSTEN